MDDRTRHKLIPLIDACRAGRQDWEQPELAPLAAARQSDAEVSAWLERSEELDASLREAFEEVPVPEGLAERLSQAVSAEPKERDAVVPRRPASVFSPRRRPVWMLAAGMTAAAAVLLLLWGSWPPPAPVAAEQLALAARQWADEVVEPTITWREAGSAPAGRPVAHQVRGEPQRWCRLSAWDDGRAVAYDLAPPGRPQVLLFVLRTGRKCGVRSTPFSRLPMTGGLAGAWQTPDCLYVLVVREGDRLESYLRSTPLTRTRTFHLIVKV